MSAAPTRQGWTVAVSGVLAALIGRAFGVLELFVIAAAMVVAVAAAWIAVAVRVPRVRVRRWIRPAVLTAGDTGRVEVVVESAGVLPAPSFELVEPVGATRTARMAVAALPRRRAVSAGYRVPTERRGVLLVGPLTASRQDVLGLARSVRHVAGAEELLVSPRAHLLKVPDLGDGVLGRHLLALAQRLGQGEFHSLRDYVEGDEPRSIHWRASARSDNLKVRQHTVEGLRRCLVVLDLNSTGIERHRDGRTEVDDAFERAVEIAASVVHSADQVGLTTRFVTTDGADVRGPDVAAQTLHLLARVQPSRAVPAPVERDPGEGLGLVVVITPDPASTPWQALERVHDPSLTPLGVFTEQLPRTRGPLALDARSIHSFLLGWDRLTGGRRRRDADLEAGLEPDADAWSLAGSTP
jgi:uncharacterized protein (DUF58 family)